MDILLTLNAGTSQILPTGQRVWQNHIKEEYLITTQLIISDVELQYAFQTLTEALKRNKRLLEFHSIKDIV